MDVKTCQVKHKTVALQVKSTNGYGELMTKKNMYWLFTVSNMTGCVEIKALFYLRSILL